MNKILLPFAILYVIYLRKKYKRLTIKWRFKQSNQHLAILKLLQAKIHYYYKQFNYWGYYHPSCIGSERWDKLLAWLFPNKNYQELELLTWSNPEAVTYYHNKIFECGQNVDYSSEITEQLNEWNNNY